MGGAMQADIEYSLHNQTFKTILKQSAFVRVNRGLATCFTPLFGVVEGSRRLRAAIVALRGLQRYVKGHRLWLRSGEGLQPRV